MTSTKILWDVIEDGNRYRSFVRVDQSQGLRLLEKFKSGKSLTNSWHPVDLVLLKEKEENEKVVADFMSGFVSIAISEKAKLALWPLLVNQVEYLPLNTDVGSYYAINVGQIDCLNKSLSIVKLFENSKIIMRVEKYAFEWDKLDKVHLFRVPELGLSRLFVSDAFKRAVEENILTGLLFYSVPMI